MTLPVLTKTWQFNVNRLGISNTVLNQARDGLLWIKNSLVGFALSPWTVVASCTSLAVKNVGDPAPLDLWQVGTDLVWHNTTRSWIVLQNTAIGIQVVIDLNNSTNTAQYFSMFVTRQGVNADGTVTARPTAPDYLTVTTGLWGMGSQNAPSIFHVLHSTDGECTRIFMHRSNAVVGWYHFEKAKDPPAIWTPLQAVFHGRGTNLTTDLQTVANTVGATATFSGYCPAGTTGMSPTVEYGGGNPLPVTLQAGDEDRGDWPLFGLGLIATTLGSRGHRGYFHDLWMGASNRAIGDTYPSDGSRQFAQIGPTLVVPWNGTLPRVAV